jgi:hypothetical protein
LSGFAGRAIVYAQIETRCLRFDTGQYQRPAAFGAGRPKVVDELEFERVWHSRDQSAFYDEDSESIPHDADSMTALPNLNVVTVNEWLGLLLVAH